MNGSLDADDRLRRALLARSEGARPGASCPSAEVLWDLARGTLAAEAARQAALHAVACAACRQALRLARELGEEPDVSSRVTPSARPATPRWPWFVAAAAVAAGIATFLLRPVPPDGSTPPVFRLETATGISPLTSGETPQSRAGLTLHWTGVAGATYEVTLARKNLTILATLRGLTAPQCAVPVDVLAALAPGEPLLWQVEAQTADGRKIRSRTFSVRLE